MSRLALCRSAVRARVVAAGWGWSGIGLAIVAFLIAAYGVAIGFKQTPKEHDRLRVLSVDDLGFDEDPEFETLTRRAFIDGRMAIDYEYDPPDGELAISFSYVRERTALAARELSADQRALTRFLEKRTGLDEATVDHPNMPTWGEEPLTRVTLLDGEPFGFTVDVRKGRHVFNIMITGVDIELDELDEVLCAVLERSVRLARGLVH